MKILAQTMKNGSVQVLEAPAPLLPAGHVRVQTLFSAISPGTEGNKIVTGKKSLIGKARAKPDQVKQVLEMATINGARAQGTADRLGSLEVGKLADLIAVDMSGPETMPLYNPISQLVYACDGNQVSHSWINGKLVMKDRQLRNIHIEGIMQKIRSWQHRIGS